MQIPFVLHLPDCARHAGARQMQRVADVGHLDAHALALELLNRVEILDIGRRDALRQRREQLTGALGLITGVQQRLDLFNGHSYLLHVIIFVNYLR